MQKLPVEGRQATLGIPVEDADSRSSAWPMRLAGLCLGMLLGVAVLAAHANSPSRTASRSSLAPAFAFTPSLMSLSRPQGLRPGKPSTAAARAPAPDMFFDQIFGGGKAKASHILLDDGGRAKYIKGQIEDGEITFQAAAKQYSTCPSSSKGGDLGLFGPGQMVPQFDQYCFDPNTALNEMGIVRTEFGTHIVKLTKKP